MSDDNSAVNKARIDHLEKLIEGMNGDVHENTQLLHRTREELAAIKTEMRIFGSLMLGGLGTLIAVLLSHFLG